MWRLASLVVLIMLAACTSKPPIDPGRFRKFVQQPGDIGKPGYWSAGVTP